MPETSCQEIEAMLDIFWWGSKNGEGKIHWLSLDKMARAKGGGMGFRGISEFNISLLARRSREKRGESYCLIGDDLLLVGRFP